MQGTGMGGTGMEGSGRLRAAVRVAALIVGSLSGGTAPHAAELPPFPADPGVLARARAVQALPCGGEGAVDGFAPDRGAPAAWRVAGALVSVRRGEKDRFAFVLGPPQGGTADCAVEDVIPLPRGGQLLECSLPSGRVAGLGVHALLEGKGLHLVLWSYDGGTGLRRQGEDKSNETDTGELICALPDLSGSRPAQQPSAASARLDLGATGVALALLGIVLTYAVLGVPLRSVAGPMGGPPVMPGRGALAEAAAALASRTVLAFLTFGLLSLPGAGAVGGMVVLACLVAALRFPRRGSPAPGAPPEPPSRVAVTVATLINDGSASLAGVVCLALLAHHEAWLLVLGVALAPAASAPSFILRRRRLRRAPRALIAAAALLAVVVGLSMFADPWVAAAVGQAVWPRLLGPLLLASIVAGVGLSRAARDV